MLDHGILAQFQEKITEKQVLVLGDLMVDEYVVGKVKRISPEAPVPVLNYSDNTRTPGGASNVALNLSSLGAGVMIAGVAAEDDAGSWLRSALEEKGIDVSGILSESERPTTIKTRYATNGQQLLRVDHEVSVAITKNTKDKILQYLEGHLGTLDAVILSDYCKGMFDDPHFVQDIIKRCNDSQVFVAIDSKSKNIESFKNADVVKPNNLELEAAVSIPIEDDDSFDLAGRTYLEKSEARGLLVTRGGDGMSFFRKGEVRRNYPAARVQVFDVTGAGDTVISVVSLAAICGFDIDRCCELANWAAGIVITKVGTVCVTVEEMMESVS